MIIIEGEIKEKVIQVLADTVDRQIIEMITTESKSVSAIAESIDLSISSAYRRLKILEDTGIVFIERSLDDELNKPVNRYRSSFSHIKIEFNGRKTHVEVESTKKIIEQTYQLFSVFKRR